MDQVIRPILQGEYMSQILFQVFFFTEIGHVYSLTVYVFSCHGELISHKVGAYNNNDINMSIYTNEFNKRHRMHIY